MPRVGWSRYREECGRCYYSNNGTLTHHLPLQNRLRLSRNKTAQVGVSLRRLIAFNMHERTASVRIICTRACTNSYNACNFLKSGSLTKVLQSSFLGKIKCYFYTRDRFILLFTSSRVFRYININIIILRWTQLCVSVIINLIFLSSLFYLCLSRNEIETRNKLDSTYLFELVVVVDRSEKEIEIRDT